jgi:hypothetical protein
VISTFWQRRFEEALMDLLEMLAGPGKKQEYDDFIKRYDQGSPWEGYSDQEVLDRYGSVAHNASAGDYEEAAREAFARLSPEERREFAEFLQQRAQTKGVNIPAPPPDRSGGLSDLGWLSGITRQLHQQPGLVREILGGITGQSQTGGRGGGLLASPLGKAALAGITAMLVKRAMGKK